MAHHTVPLGGIRLIFEGNDDEEARKSKQESKNEYMLTLSSLSSLLSMDSTLPVIRYLEGFLEMLDWMLE